MSKYFCFCGMEFSSNKKAIEHKELFKTVIEEQIIHVIFERSWKATLIRFIDKLGLQRIFSILGCAILYATLTHHFNIQFDALESSLIGLSLALIAS